MRKVDASAVQWEQISQHRKESPWFRRLLQGERGALDNYEFALVRVDEDYDTPRHNHNFDQVRIMLDGSFDFGGQVQEAGTIGYFPAGTYYTQSARGPSVTLLLQIGAACKQGYLDFAQVRSAAADLAKTGEFKDGIYHFEDDSGALQTLDGYEAVFKHAAGFAPRNPEPRFDGPIIINTSAVDAIPSPLGGSTRFFGTFNEYGLTLSQRTASSGQTLTLRPASGQKALFYVQSGALALEMGESLGEGTALELAVNETLTGTAKEDLALYQIDVPNFGDVQSEAA